MNSYKTILAVARDPGKAKALFAQALELAGRWNGHVTGMYAAPPIAVHPALRGRQLDEWMEVRVREQSETAAKVKAAFDAASRSAGGNAEWRHEDAAVTPDTRRSLDFARCADITLICRSRSDSDFMDPDLTLEDLLIGSGRPVLMLPGTTAAGALGQRIAIAWNGSREAARAVHDAMPLLITAPPGSIQIICPGETGKSGMLPMGADLAESLSRHGVNARVETLDKRHMNAGPDVLAKAGELGTDLLVMGAWGHTRLREFVLGGATDTALRESRIPVLMSH
jgi:nucleotide-binding universal stress UspA family protein